ncbi:hypothetical protein [Candidatus Uabimicrobium sp. HlEnr_7]|uniref:hypothetical protein n=1 Tax=Candidatus Uabimicrobium helgolandensis TaxID=3095367 RepID=UPI003555C51B
MKISKNHCALALFFSIILFSLGCENQQRQSANTEEQKVQIVIQEVDTRPPSLNNIQPANGSTFGHNTENIIVSGVVTDASEISAMTINSKEVNFAQVAEENSLKVYGFTTSIDLETGSNSFILEATDQDGNKYEQSFAYVRKEPEFVKELIVKPEVKELSLAGTTFVEVFAIDGEQERPLTASEVTLKAQQGYFSGFQYHAPAYGGMDVITATYSEQKAKGKAYLVIHSPKLKQNIQGPKNIQIGKTGKFTIKVENPGDRDAVDARIAVKLPDFLKAESLGGGKLIAAVNELHWKLDNLSSGASKEISFSVRALEAQRGKVVVSTLSAKEEIIKEAQFIKVTGEVAVEHFCTPSIAEIEKEITTQVQVVANEDVKNLKLNYEFSDECVFVDAEVIFDGAKIGFANSGKNVQFSTVSGLDKGKTVTYKLTFLVRRYGQMNNIARINLVSERDEEVETSNTLTIPTLD